MAGAAARHGMQGIAARDAVSDRLFEGSVGSIPRDGAVARHARVRRHALVKVTAS
jgi:hypothetical protein